MNKTALQNLIYWKAGISSDDTDETNMVDSVISEVLLDICKRHPWSFLRKKDTSLTLSEGDYQKQLPSDFLHLIAVDLIDSGNVIYPLHSIKPTRYASELPDLDTEDQPYYYWWYYDSNRDPYIEIRPKADTDYTLHVWYLEKLDIDDVSVIPNGLVLFYGVMVALAKSDEFRYATVFKKLYEEGIAQMWASDRVDEADEPYMDLDDETKQYNTFMSSI